LNNGSIIITRPNVPPLPAISARSGNLVAAIATVAACDIAFGLTLQLIPLNMDAAGWPAWAIGLNTAMGPVGILLAGPFLPKLIGNAGTKQAALVIIAILVASLAAISLSPIWLWFPLRFIFGMTTSALFTISEAWVLTFSTEQNRGRVMSLYTSTLAVTFSVGPLLLPWTGIHGPLPWVIGIICIGLSALPLTFVRVADDHFQQKEGGGFFGFVRRAPLLLFAIAAATLFDNVLISFFTIYGLRHGLALEEASRILGFGIIGNVLMFYPMGWLADRWSRKAVVVISASATVLLSLSLLVVVGHWIIWPVMMLLTGSAFGVYVVSLATMGDRFQGPDLIAGSAAVAAMWGVGGLVGPPVAGLAIDVLGINAMPVTLAGFYVILLLGLLLTGGELVRKPAHG
jgi:MFS family permease